MVSPVPEMRLPRKAFPLPFNRLAFGVTLVANNEGVSFWHGIFVRRYVLVPWSQIESVGMHCEASKERVISLVVLRMSIVLRPVEFLVMGSPWTFGLCAIEDEAAYAAESLEKARGEQP